MVPPDDYVKALDKALSDLEIRVRQRDLLDAEIAGLRETVRVLSSRVSLTPEKQRQVAQLFALVDYATPSLTDSIRSLLTRIHPNEMTAIEVRNSLEESQFNFDDFSNSLAACHAALKRMLTEGELEPGKPKDGKPSYRLHLQLKMPKIPRLSDFAKAFADYEPVGRDNLTNLALLMGETKTKKK